MEQDPAQFSLPEKLPNQGRYQHVENTRLVLNAYNLNVERAIPYAYKHELKFNGQNKKNETKDLSRGGKNDVSSQQKRGMLNELCQQMLTTNADFFGNDLHGYVYDCGINFYSPNQLLNSGESRDFPLDIERLSEDARTYLGRNIVSITAHLLACETIDLHSKDALTEEQDRSTVQFFDILTNQEIIQNGRYLFFPSKIFERASNIRLNVPLAILKDGMQKNARFVGENVQDARPIIQIDPKKSAFFPEGPLVGFLENVFQRGITGNNQTQAARLLKGIVVITTHLQRNRSFEIYGLTRDPSTRVTFDHNGHETAVSNYYEATYTVRLHHPNLPCVIERKPRQGGGTQDSFYPLELLKIMPGQRVPLNKQTPQLTEQMIRNCQVLPQNFRNLNVTAKNNANINNTNQFMAAYQVRVDSDPIEEEASVLFPPAITYTNPRDRDEPDGRGMLNWKLGQRTFFMPANPPRVWCAVIFGQGVQGGECEQFIGALVQTLNRRGIQIQRPTRWDVFEDTSINSVREKMQNYKEQGKVEFVMFFTREKFDPVHNVMKLMEIEKGILCQHVSQFTLRKAIGDRGACMVLDNISLKTNLKLGGVNYGLSTAGGFGQRNRIDGDIVANEWLSPSRMFIGLDMSHAAPQSLFDRQANVVCSEPTIVGCAYTCGHPVRMMGTYWMQQTRLTYIENMREQIKTAIKNYSTHAKCFPKHLIVFRGGISEGEYRILVEKEQSAFMDVFDELVADAKGFKKPYLTIVVCQKNSNYRVVPSRVTGQKPHEQNVRAGTCLDKSMHPSLTEFLLVGHKTIQGTARPLRCTVITDTTPGRMSLEEIEQVSNLLCFTHGIVLSPVSVPGPLYSASDLAKRCRNNWKAANFDDEGGSGGSGAQDRMQPGDDAATFFGTMSNKFRPSIHTKFWA